MSALAAYTISLDVHFINQSMDSQSQVRMQTLGTENVEAGFHSGWLVSTRATRLKEHDYEHTKTRSHDSVTKPLYPIPMSFQNLLAE